jgi:putative addiction module killer protein
MDDIRFQLLRTQEFNEWLSSQTEVVQSLVLARLHRISLDGHFGFTNHFDGLIELKWKSGLRVYTARVGQMLIVILGGGNKNGQSKDIKQAKKVLNKIKGSIIGGS